MPLYKWVLTIPAVCNVYCSLAHTPVCVGHGASFLLDSGVTAMIVSCVDAYTNGLGSISGWRAAHISRKEL